MEPALPGLPRPIYPRFLGGEHPVPHLSLPIADAHILYRDNDHPYLLSLDEPTRPSVAARSPRLRLLQHVAKAVGSNVLFSRCCWR